MQADEAVLNQKRETARIEQDYSNSIEQFQNVLDSERYKYSFLIPKAFIVITIVIAYYLGKFRFGFTIIFMFIYSVNFVYQNRIKRFKNSLENLIYKSAIQNKNKNIEQCAWLNYIVSRVWNVVEPTASKMVLQQINPILREKCPPFLSKLKLQTFTLGSHAPFVLGISHFDNTDDDVIIVEAEVAFIPLEMDRTTYAYVTKHKRFEWNSKIILVARLGTRVKGVGIDLPIMVKHISFKGTMRMELTLAQKDIVKTAEVTFMEMPEIDFTVVPLKTVDLMDVPGLSNWIHMTINSVLKSACVNPNSIKVDLTKKEKKIEMLGVLFMRISTASFKESESCNVEIDVDGRKLFSTATKEGINTIYNEYFYLLLEDSDENVNFKVYKSGIKNTVFGEGSVSIKKIVELENHLETVKIYHKGNVRGIYNVSFNFFRFTDKNMDNGCVVKMNVLQVDDVKGMNWSKGKVYNPFFTVLVSPKIELKPEKDSKTLLGFVTAPVNATALLLGGAITSAIPYHKREALMPSSERTFFVYESKTHQDTNSPYFNENFTFHSRFNTDIMYFRLKDGDNMLGRVDLPVSNLPHEEWHKLKDCQNGRVKLVFDQFYLDTFKNEFIEYKNCFKLTFRDVSCVYEGVFYFIVDNGHEKFFVEAILIGDFEVEKEIFIPGFDELRILVFKSNIEADEFMGEARINEATSIDKDDKDLNDGREDNERDKKADVKHKKAGIHENKIHAIPFFKGDDENGSLKVNIEKMALKEYKEGKPECLKVVQVKFNDFSNVKEEFLIEFKMNEETIIKSCISKNKCINQRFNIVTGKSEVRAIVKSAAIGVNKVIGDCLIPKRKMKEKVMLGDAKICAEVEVKVLCCDFTPKSVIKQGILELMIKGCKNLLGSSTNKIDPFVKVFLNGTRLYTTKTIKKSNDPTFNEIVKLSVNSNVDIMRIEIFDHNQFENNQLISFRELPLCFLKEGLEDVEVKLVDAKTFKKAGTIIMGLKFGKSEAKAKKVFKDQ